MATTNLGKVCVTPKGTWANYTEYEVLDIVSYQGSSYLAIQDVPDSGVALSNTSYWLCIAEKGDGGEITSVSASISGGYGTPGVTVTEGGTDHEKTLAFAFSNLVGNGVASITQTTTSAVSGGTNVITCTLVDGTVTTFAILNGTDGDAINIAPAYDSTATYDLGDLVVYNDTLYECTTAITTAEAWDSDHWTATDVESQLKKKANTDGFYDTMGVGVADNLTPYSEDSGAHQSIPFLNEGTGCGNGETQVDTGSYLQLQNKLGNTVCVNQLVDKTGFPASSGIFTNNGDGSVTANGTVGSTTTFVFKDFSPNELIIGHKYYIQSGFTTTGSGSTFELMLTQVQTGNTNVNLYGFSQIFECGNDVNIHTLQFAVRSGATVSNLKCTPFLIDLTLWFGSNDRIPADLLAHPENWGRYYAGSLAYNAGTLESADGTVLTSIGRNLWNEVVKAGYYRPDGVFVASSGYVASELIPVSPNTPIHQYSGSGKMGRVCFYDASGNFIKTLVNYVPSSSTTATFTTPSNCHFMAFDMEGAYGGTYKKDITISLYYSGESGYDQYYPFTVLASVDTGSEVLRSAGAIADEKLPSGVITRRIGVVDLGTLSWVYNSANTLFYTSPAIGDIKNVSVSALANIICSKYKTIQAANFNNGEDKSISVGALWVSGALNIRDTAYTDAAAFKTAMSGVYLYYELATPTTEQGTSFPSNIPCDDFGSLIWTQTNGVPQGNTIFYPVDYKASLDSLLNMVNGDVSDLVTDTELQAVSDRVPDAPSTDGTYSLKVSVSGGVKTYSWVADE